MDEDTKDTLPSESQVEDHSDSAAVRELRGAPNVEKAPLPAVGSKQSRRVVSINAQKLCSQCHKFPTPNTCTACGIPVCRECKVIFNGVGAGKYYCKEHSRNIEASSIEKNSKSRTPTSSSKGAKGGSKVVAAVCNTTANRRPKRQKASKPSEETRSSSSDSCDSPMDMEEVSNTQLTSSQALDDKDELENTQSTKEALGKKKKKKILVHQVPY